MADIKTPKERSINMSHIRGMDTHPEVVFRKWLFADGFRYSLGNKIIPGRPDLWMPKYNVAIFIHGCFWHRHDECKYAYTPKTRVDFWNDKFKKNVSRDKSVRMELKNRKIRMLVVWECTIKKMERNAEYRRCVLYETGQYIKGALEYKEV